MTILSRRVSQCAVFAAAGTLFACGGGGGSSANPVATTSSQTSLVSSAAASAVSSAATSVVSSVQSSAVSMAASSALASSVAESKASSVAGLSSSAGLPSSAGVSSVASSAGGVITSSLAPSSASSVPASASSAPASSSKASIASSSAPVSSSSSVSSSASVASSSAVLSSSLSSVALSSALGSSSMPGSSSKAALSSSSLALSSLANSSAPASSAIASSLASSAAVVSSKSSLAPSSSSLASSAASSQSSAAVSSVLASSSKVSSSLVASSVVASSVVSSSVVASSKASSSVATSQAQSSAVSSSIKASSSSVSSSSVAAVLTIQAEQAGFCRVDGVANEATNAGFSGIGYTNANNAVGAAIEWAINAPTSSRYTLSFRFANGGTANRDGSLLINGGANGNYSVSLAVTGAWATWQTVSLEVDLVQGNNLLKLAAVSADGLANIDLLSVEGAPVTAGVCPVVVSSSSASLSSSSVASSAVASSSVQASSSSQAGSSSAAIVLSQAGNPVHSRYEKMKTAWSAATADIVLSYQYTNGGWPKNQTYGTAGSGGSDSGTIDNGATTTEMVYLATQYNATANVKYRDAVRKGFNFLLTAQHSSGGWPQFYPLKGGYPDHATFNDNAMTRVLTVLYHIAKKDAPFDTDVFTDAQRTSAQAAMLKGVDYILKAQWKQNGTLTAWCAQHGKDDYLPKPARAYELESISGMESSEIIAFLMTQPQTPAVAASVKAALAWYRSPNTYLADYTYDSAQAATNPIVPKAGSKMWYRFYDLNTNRGFFSDRDGSKFYDITQMSLERRTGYGWGGTYGVGILKYADSVGY